MKQIEANLEISPEQAQLIDALLSNTTRTAAALACGISTPTMYRWMADPAFQQALAAAERAVISESTSRLIGLQSSSIDTLVALRKDGIPADSVKLKAAMAILQIGREMRESLQLEQRLAELEGLVVELAERQI